MKEEIKKPIVSPVYADNGEHSHWTLIDPETGEKLWSEDPEECKAMGYPVSTPPNFISKEKVMEIIERSFCQGWESGLDKNATNAFVSMSEAKEILKKEYGL